MLSHPKVCYNVRQFVDKQIVFKMMLPGEKRISEVRMKWVLADSRREIRGMVMNLKARVENVHC